MKQSEALSIIDAGASVFVTGAPGSGKTYVLNKAVRSLRKNGLSVALTASTGIAATHLNGQTIHSWSGIGVSNTLTATPVSYTHLTLPTKDTRCRSRWSPYH